MWYQNSIRRHLCDMHIDDWDERFLAEFSPEGYFENLKKAKIQNAMLYFQSHVGLCYYPTKIGKMHNRFVGREDSMKRLVDMCRSSGITVTGYYSLIYNNWAHNTHPAWRMLDKNGKSVLETNMKVKAEFANNKVHRYGFCCPNNMEYRGFVAEQIREMCAYFTFDGMFFDMLFWPHICYCPSCQKRWADEVGGKLPEKEDWSDPTWLLLMQKRREWMGEFAQFATDTLKRYAPHASVEHNCAFAVIPGPQCLAEPVLDACDYAGGDLYGGIYRQSFTCKFYKNATKNQPFEYMFSRCMPTLSKHTITKSKDEMRSAVLLTTAHHGAILVIDAIDPVGTMDERVYQQIGEVFEEEIPYEAYFEGNMIEDVGVYYSLKSKFNAHGEDYMNHTCAVNTVDTLIFNHISCGVTGGYHDISSYKILIASCLTDVDGYDTERIVKYVENGGCLYFSGGDCSGLLKAFFNAACMGRTREKVVYIAPEPEVQPAFDNFNAQYPMHFDGTAPVIEGMNPEWVAGKIVLPYTNQDTTKFVSIHSNPPGLQTDMPAMACRKFGKGKVLWSALPIENAEYYGYRHVFINLLNQVFRQAYTLLSDAPKDVEIIGFKAEDFITVSAVLLCEDYEARHVTPFRISLKCENKPKDILLLPEEIEVPFTYENGRAVFEVNKLNILNMYKICF